jgi:hypothetical protein
VRSASNRDGAVRRLSIPPHRIDLVEERAALFEAADVVEDDRGGGLRIGDAGDVRGGQDARMLPKGVTGRQRFFAEDVEGRSRKLPRIERGDQILLDEVGAPAGIDQASPSGRGQVLTRDGESRSGRTPFRSTQERRDRQASPGR